MSSLRGSKPRHVAIGFGMLALYVLLSLVLASCGEDSSPTAPVVVNHAPTAPSIDTAGGSPADAATDVALSAVLRWTCTDEDGDALSYTVYFGTNSDPSEVVASQSESNYTPASLANSTTYYWKIAAKDPSNETATSAVWSFTTAAPGNTAPAVPAIDTVSGAPADAAIDIPLSAVLAWSCSDPDGDNLLYTVNFGTAPAPPVVANSQSGLTYTPAGLASDTTYYWQITAKDVPAGATTASPVWSFKTAVAVGPETISEPTMPTGPNVGDIGQRLTYWSLSATSSHGHVLEYRMDWGDLSTSIWSTSNRFQRSWPSAGSYDLRTQARCSIHTDIESEWSIVRALTILDDESVATPDAPTGPAGGETNESLAYTTSGTTNSRGHAVEYRFNWGGNAITYWSSNLSASYTWSNVGEQDVRVQARCKTHPTIESEWSPATVVTVVLPGETLTRPGNGAGALGPVGGAVDADQTFTIRWASTSNIGHAVEHQFDWDDGQQSTWGTAIEGTYAWSAAGSYTVKIRGRCIEHPTAVSDWSLSDPIEITDAAEALSDPTSISILSSVSAFSSASFRVIGVTSNIDDPIEYRMDWGIDGISEWQDSDLLRHAFQTSGLVEIKGQARCKLHPEIITAWSPVREVSVKERNSSIAEPTGPSNAVTGEELTFSHEACVNSAGHPVEYQFFYDTSAAGYHGPSSDWTTSFTGSYTYTTAGAKIVKVKSRCTLDPDILGGSVYHIVYVTEAP